VDQGGAVHNSRNDAQKADALNCFFSSVVIVENGEKLKSVEIKVPIQQPTEAEVRQNVKSFINHPGYTFCIHQSSARHEIIAYT